MSAVIRQGDCLDVLKGMAAESVNCVVTSPPYWGLRDYGNGAGGIGLEPTYQEHIAALVEVFRQVRRVLRKDGVVWLNYGDAYASGGGSGKQGTRGQRFGRRHTQEPLILNNRTGGLKPKDLIGLPWRLALALQDDGWWLRQDNIWFKRNPMPDSTKDRTTRAHEYVFHLTRSERYWYDWEAIREPAVSGRPSGNGYARPEQVSRDGRGAADPWAVTEWRNCRSVWDIPIAPYPGAHFATFPPALAERCIKAGCPEGGTVLDPFGGAGTVGLVADRLKRNAVLIELNPDYCAMARRRLIGDAPLLVEVDSQA